MRLEQLEKRIGSIQHNQMKMKVNERAYYDEVLDRELISQYYYGLDLFMGNSRQKFNLLHSLVERTHKNRLSYFVSKDEYLYTWVDLQPNGNVKSIYSGEENHPADLLRKDYEVTRRQKEADFKVEAAHHLDKTVPEEFKFNAEHIVPQSWFGGREPMKGDLHHLFACDPGCNAKRANFAFHDFPYYDPESPDEKIRNNCGIADFDFFEPEYGKGTVARAMLYFILRYPNEIRRPFGKRVNFQLLREWNAQFPPLLHEKHRNQAIQNIQGNRNPFIDFPDLADNIYFPLKA
ncbi:endonuclease I family protein [Lederbergia wuyishanensis]|uniref:Endonuclease I n=1 Tax=Lederbergia wuyishanensis TaxID=1347903 RepID=A0ABU0DAY5_9BACI|nr:endonuclease [Lederbergia wuyishanensis]MCJ8010073.1 endonuclease [Lederbergia wuyishanensis]MDQ0345587.1 endonuclease I [Lederbergia wuyishanensis]